LRPGITSAPSARVTRGASKARSLCPIVPMSAGFAAHGRSCLANPAARQLPTERADNAPAPNKPGSARSVDLFADDGISDARRVADPHGVNVVRWWTLCDRVLYARITAHKGYPDCSGRRSSWGSPMAPAIAG
jgi:hypothetical protein